MYIKKQVKILLQANDLLHLVADMFLKMRQAMKLEKYDCRQLQKEHLQLELVPLLQVGVHILKVLEQ
jgi:hypothetical protein